MSNFSTDQKFQVRNEEEAEQKMPLTTLYIGNLNKEVTEEFLMTLFLPFGSIKSCKLFRDENPYAFVEFNDHQAAESARNTMAGGNCFGKQMKINWATANLGIGATIYPKLNTSSHFHVFVGDLSSETTELDLKNIFHQFGTISDCRVVRDPLTCKSKGYGFVSFTEKGAAETAIEQMNGYWLKSRSIRTNWALRKIPVTGASGTVSDQGLSYQKISNSTSPMNSTVFCGNIINGLSETLLNDIFSPFGRIVEIRAFQSKGYGFVKFLDKSSAVNAIIEMNQKEVNGAVMKVSWGKESNQWNPYNNEQWTGSSGSHGGQGMHGNSYSYLGVTLDTPTQNPYQNFNPTLETNSGNLWSQVYSHPASAAHAVQLQQQFYVQSLMHMYGYPYNYGYSMQTQPTMQLSKEERTTTINGDDNTAV